jgi:bacteriorhodopsin
MENFLNIFLLGDVPNDLVSFTFFIGTMAMMAASVFFFLSLDAGGGKWRTSMLVSGLITFIAAVHYYYMRDASVSGGDVTFFRYVDWILTVPLMCVEFYLLTRAAGATKSLLWKLIIASTWMLVCGYIGESFSDGTTAHSVTWGVLSTLGYIYILHAAWFGEVAQLAEKSNSDVVKRGVRTLAWFVLVGWAIHPIGYMCMDGG